MLQIQFQQALRVILKVINDPVIAGVNGSVVPSAALNSTECNIKFGTVYSR